MRDCANCTPDHLLCTTYSIAAMLSEPIPQDDFMCVVEDKGRTAEELRALGYEVRELKDGTILRSFSPEEKAAIGIVPVDFSKVKLPSEPWKVFPDAPDFCPFELVFRKRAS